MYCFPSRHFVSTSVLYITAKSQHLQTQTGKLPAHLISTGLVVSFLPSSLNYSFVQIPHLNKAAFLLIPTIIIQQPTKIDETSALPLFQTE